MNILISGGTGFLGINLINDLSNHKLLVLSRKKRKNNKNIKYLKCNLSRPESFRKQIKNFRPEIFIHLAWEGLPNYSSYFSFKNFINSKNIIEQLIEIKSLKKIIVSGSCFEGDNMNGKIKETSITKKKNFFSLSKNFLKDWIFQYYKYSNVKIAWVRIFYVYGKGQRNTSLIPSLIDAKINKKKIKIKTPNDFCDFIHVKDVVSFFKILINKKFKSSTFNLGTGKRTKVINICKKILQKDFKRLCIYNNKSKMKNYYWANMSNTKKETGFKIKISLDNGLKKII